MSRSRIEERAKDAVARWMLKQLILPSIFFDPEWPDEGGRVDVLAIDRNGVGDVHVVEIRESPGQAIDAILALKQVPAAYRWVAILADSVSAEDYRRIIETEVIYLDAGMGRVGIIEVLRRAGDELKAEVGLSAERFKGSYYKMADQFTAKHEPDVQYRDEVTPAT